MGSTPIHPLCVITVLWLTLLFTRRSGCYVRVLADMTEVKLMAKIGRWRLIAQVETMLGIALAVMALGGGPAGALA